MRYILKNGLIYKGSTFIHTDIAVEGGVVSETAPSIKPFNDDIIFDFNNCYIMPGLADVHVHLREPGFSYKETIKSGTAAAARGGYTLVCAMPNLNPVPDSPEHIQFEQEIIERDALIDVLPYSSITAGQAGRGEPVDFENISKSCRIAGFSDDGRGIQERALMKAVMERVRHTGAMIAAHCEDESLLNGGCIHDGEYARANSFKGICSESEWKQIERDIELVRETGCRYHVCHVSAKESVRLIREAKADGLPVTCETAPHYLLLTDTELRDEGRFKMNPPIRSAADRDALIEGISDGTIDIIATDHAPHSKEEKGRGLRGSSMGIVGLETAAAMIYTGLVLSGRISMARMIELMAVAPRKVLGLPVPELCRGAAADITVFDPSMVHTVDSAKFISAGKSTPFDGMTAAGDIVFTMVKGNIVWRLR